MQVVYVKVGCKQPLACWPQREMGYNHMLALNADWGTPSDMHRGRSSSLELQSVSDFTVYIYTVE